MPVFKRGKYFHYEFALDGERYRGSTKQTTLTKARAVEADLILKVRDGINPLGRKKTITLRQVSTLFLAEMQQRFDAGNADKDTLRHYKNGWRMLEATSVADMRIDEITTGYAAGLKFPGGPWAARAGQQVLSRLLNWAAENGYLRVAPRIKRTKAQGRSLRVTAQVEAALLEHMEADCADIFLIMLDCGMRPEEVMRMRWEHIHWDQRQYWNPFGKTQESRRMVPMSDRMIDRLRVRRQNPPVTPKMAVKFDSWVFPGKRAAEHRKSIATQYEQARDAAGLDQRYVLYLARHEFATTFLENGGDLGTLMKVMGHTSIETTQKYLHPGIQGAADIINRRNRAGLRIVKRA